MHDFPHHGQANVKFKILRVLSRGVTSRMGAQLKLSQDLLIESSIRLVLGKITTAMDTGNASPKRHSEQDARNLFTEIS